MINDIEDDEDPASFPYTATTAAGYPSGVFTAQVAAKASRFDAVVNAVMGSMSGSAASGFASGLSADGMGMVARAVAKQLLNNQRKQEHEQRMEIKEKTMQQKGEELMKLLEQWRSESSTPMANKLRGKHDRLVEVYHAALHKAGTYPWVRMPMSRMVEGCIFRFTQAPRTEVFYLVEPIKQSKDSQNNTVFSLVQVPVPATENKTTGDVDLGDLTSEQIRNNAMTTNSADLGTLGGNATRVSNEYEAPKQAPIPDKDKVTFKDSVDPEDYDPMEVTLYNWFWGTHAAMVPFLRDLYSAFMEGTRNGFELDHKDDRCSKISEAIGQVAMPDVYMVTKGEFSFNERNNICVTMFFDSTDASRSSHKHEILIEPERILVTTVDQPAGLLPRWLGESTTKHKGRAAAVIPAWMLRDEDPEEDEKVAIRKRVKSLVKRSNQLLDTLEDWDDTLPNKTISDYLKQVYHEFVHARNTAVAGSGVSANYVQNVVGMIPVPDSLHLKQQEVVVRKGPAEGVSVSTFALYLQFEVRATNDRKVHMKVVFPTSASGLTDAEMEKRAVPLQGTHPEDWPETHRINVPLMEFNRDSQREDEDEDDE